jgi:hypothetical protein
MKHFIKASYFVLVSMTVFLFSNCKEELSIPIKVPYTGTFSVDVTAAPGGTKTFSKTIDNSVKTFLSSKSIALDKISAVELNSLIAVIPPASDLDFGQLSSGSFNIGGIDVASISNPPAGKSATYKLDKTDVRVPLLEDKLVYSLTATTKQATVAATVTVTYAVTITYKL